MAGENRPGIDLFVNVPVLIDDPSERGRKNQPGHVVKVGRTWVTIKRVGGNEQRFRIDSQSENAGYGYGGDRFKTLPQAEYDDRINAAWQVLTDHGLNAEHSARRRLTDDQLFAIADLLGVAESASR